MGLYEDNAQALAVAIVANVPTIMWGDCGIGKTSVVNAISERYNFHMETIIASISEPADFGGLPIVDSTTTPPSVTRAAQGWAVRLTDAIEDENNDAQGAIAFYDEISTAPPSVQAALLRPILENVVGDHRLPREVRSIAAANPASIAADGWDLAPPMANRFFHLNWTMTPEVFMQGFTQGWPEINFPNIDGEFEETVSREFKEVKALIASYIHRNRGQMMALPKSSDQSGRAFPSPRSWEAAAKLYAHGKAMRVSDDVITVLVNGCVGESAAIEFLNYINSLDLPDPEDILKNPTAYRVPVERGDIVYAVCNSVFSAAIDSEAVKEKDPAKRALILEQRWVAAGEFLSHVSDAGLTDVATVFARMWATNPPSSLGKESMAKLPKVLKSFQAILAELKKSINFETR